MQITFQPQRHDDALSLERKGDVLLVNGEPVDFGPLAEGARLPAEAIGSPWFAGPVERVEGELRIALILPHGPVRPDGSGVPRETLFPAPVIAAEDGPIPVPPYAEKAPEPEGEA